MNENFDGDSDNDILSCVSYCEFIFFEFKTFLKQSSLHCIEFQFSAEIESTPLQNAALYFRCGVL